MGSATYFFPQCTEDPFTFLSGPQDSPDDSLHGYYLNLDASSYGHQSQPQLSSQHYTYRHSSSPSMTHQDSPDMPDVDDMGMNTGADDARLHYNQVYLGNFHRDPHGVGNEMSASHQGIGFGPPIHVHDHFDHFDPRFANFTGHATTNGPPNAFSPPTSPRTEYHDHRPMSNIPTTNESASYKHVVATENIRKAAAQRRTQPPAFECTECGTSFTTKFKLRSHEKAHLGIKDFACTIPGCIRKFVRKSDLQRHIEKTLHHQIPRDYM